MQTLMNRARRTIAAVTGEARAMQRKYSRNYGKGE